MLNSIMSVYIYNLNIATIKLMYAKKLSFYFE